MASSSAGTPALAAGPMYDKKYTLEISKSNRAECKKCNKKIDKDVLKVGVTVASRKDAFTKWHHVQCTIFTKDITNPSQIEKYQELLAQANNSAGNSLSAMLAEVAQRVIDSQNEVDEDEIPLDTNEMVRKVWNEAVEPTSELLLPLMRFQKEGLGWMIHQEEKSGYRGGILADEMGMGKHARRRVVKVYVGLLHD